VWAYPASDTTMCTCALCRLLIRFRARREDWTVKGMTAGRKKSLLSRRLGVFTTVLSRDVPTRSIRLLW
jgi:hypothetical protein